MPFRDVPPLCNSTKKATKAGERKDTNKPVRKRLAIVLAKSNNVESFDICDGFGKYGFEFAKEGIFTSFAFKKLKIVIIIPNTNVKENAQR